MRIYKHIITILVLANMFLMFACTNDMDISQPVEPGLEDKVSISLFTRAQDYSIPVTRGGANETGIEKTPYVLVFKVDGTSTKCIETVRAVEDLTTDKRYVLLTRQATGTYRFLYWRIMERISILKIRDTNGVRAIWKLNLLGKNYHI